MTNAWSNDDQLKLWLLVVLLFSYVCWLVSGLSSDFQDQAAVATLVSLVGTHVCVTVCCSAFAIHCYNQVQWLTYLFVMLAVWKAEAVSFSACVYGWLDGSSEAAVEEVDAVAYSALPDEDGLASTASECEQRVMCVDLIFCSGVTCCCC